jgi:hypothetical protein
MKTKNLAKGAVLALLFSLLTGNAASAVHDSGANGNTIVFSDYSSTTTSATAIAKSVSYFCFNSVPEATIEVEVGGLVTSGGGGSTGGGETRFEVTWTQASTSQTVTFSPRFINRLDGINNSKTASFRVVIDYSTFSLQVSTADTVTIAYAAPAGGASDISFAPDAGGALSSLKATSFSNLAVPSSIFATSRVGAGSCFPSAPLNIGGGGNLPGQNSATPAPAKYSGPEFSSLSLKPVMHGSSTTLTGKRLTQVSSIEIGGKAATFTAVSDTELSLTPAADLAPGTYDLVINSAAGKLTHMNAVRIQPALRSFSVTTRAENRITEEQYQEHSLIASMQQSELTKARCIVNGPNLAQAKAQAERLCALVKAANPNIETTVIDPRSTVKNNTVFARVTYGWN